MGRLSVGRMAPGLTSKGGEMTEGGATVFITAAGSAAAGSAAAGGGATGSWASANPDIFALPMSGAAADFAFATALTAAGVTTSGGSTADGAVLRAAPAGAADADAFIPEPHSWNTRQQTTRTAARNGERHQVLPGCRAVGAVGHARDAGAISGQNGLITPIPRRCVTQNQPGVCDLTRPGRSGTIQPRMADSRDMRLAPASVRPWTSERGRQAVDVRAYRARARTA